MHTPVAGRFHNLDAMRGFAALVVLIYHVGSVMPAANWFAPGGYLAVDFFFLLSGFVIAHAYDARLARGMTLGRFALVRVIRLYPMFLAGVLIGCVKPLLMILMHNDKAPAASELLGWLGTNALMLPAPGANTLFPLNAPAWSLFFEIVINLIYAAVLVEAPAWVLAIIAAVSGVVIGFGAITRQTLDLGWGWSDFGYGMARVGFSFPVGILAFRLGASRRRKAGLVALAPMALLVGVMLLPKTPDMHGTVDAAIVLLAFPLLLWWSARLEAPRWLVPAASLTGDLSYPVYAIHYPMLFLYVSLMHRIDDLKGFGFIVLASLVSFIFLKFYDEPVRAWMTHRLKRGKAAAGASVKP